MKISTQIISRFFFSESSFHSIHFCLLGAFFFTLNMTPDLFFSSCSVATDYILSRANVTRKTLLYLLQCSTMVISRCYGSGKASIVASPTRAGPVELKVHRLMCYTTSRK